MSWWPFSKRFSRLDASPKVVLPIRLPSDLSVFASNDECIKLWLPEKLTQALDTLSAAQEMSRPDVLRWLLFEHVYGRAALEELRSWKRRRDGNDVRYSPRRGPPSERPYTAQLLGKSVEDFKLWLPSPLKEELQGLAQLESLGLSDYLRKTLVRILLGESFHHRWRAEIGKLAAEVRRFEQEEV